MATSRLTKEDVPFLVNAMNARFRSRWKVSLNATDMVSGDMNVPKPVTVDVNGTMSTQDYKACSTIMSVCQNMVQKTLTDAAQKAGIPAADALKNMNAWVKAYVDFPFPFFTFKDTQDNTYHKSDFSLTADPQVVEQVVNIKGLSGLKDAVVGAMKASGGNLASYAGTDRKFNYFGVITGYNETEIVSRVIKFQMNMKTTNVDSLCVKYTQTTLDTAYDTYQFVADKELMIKIQAKMGDQLVDYFADKLLTFVKDFYDSQFKEFHDELVKVLKPAP